MRRFTVIPWRLRPASPRRWLAWVILVLPGCGPALPALVDVRGTVTCDGQPVARGQIAFVPDGPGQPGLGYLAADGTYQLMSHGGRRGVLPGSYRVSIVAAEGSFENEDVRHLIPERFMRLETSGLSAVVPADLREGATFDFHLP